MSRKTNQLNDLLDKRRGRVALLIGNGIHRYNALASGNDWANMMQNLAMTYGLDATNYQSGLALTELYDLIDLKIPDGQKPSQLQKEFCHRMDEWESLDHHKKIVEWAISNNSPILTTNFDRVLSDSVGAKFHSLFRPTVNIKGPTDYYPWEKYFALDQLDSPCDGFGIWHINGVINHIRSIRLGLSQYMGSVSRARPWFHGSKETRLFTQNDINLWRGWNTWLDIVFNLPLVIFGLALDGQEVFLRWLLIERAKYFRQFPDRKKSAWYIYPHSENDSSDQAKHFFLQSLGITSVCVDDYTSIYESKAW